MSSKEEATDTTSASSSAASLTSKPVAQARGVSPARSVRRSGAGAGEAGEPGRPRQPVRILRLLYFAVWFVLVPFALACMVVFGLTPPSGVERGGVLGWVEGWVREQPVPMAIVSFTLFEMVFWALRSRLPLASHAYPPLRADLPSRMGGPFEHARALLEDAEAIFNQNRNAILRDVPLQQRNTLKASLNALEDEMTKEPFDEDAFCRALERAEAEVDEHLGRFRKSEIREYAESILVAIAVALTLRAFVVEAFKIPTPSMVPTLQVGDHIFVNKFIYGPAIPWTQKRLWSRMPPERGDVIVFAYPENMEQDFIKRVVAVPGDKLEARGGHPIINGWEVPSCNAGTYSYLDVPNGLRHEGTIYVEYLEHEAYLTLYDHLASRREYEGPFYVKPGEVYVMGDNRNNSHDSRAWHDYQGAGVPFENIRGRALFIWLSVGDQADRSRIFAPVMGRPPARGPLGPLPDAMRAIEPAIEQCLRNRPPLDRTHPPPAAPPAARGLR